MMSTVLFKRNGKLLIPAHVFGWLFTIACMVACAWFFIVIDRSSHSVSDTLLRFFVYVTCVLFWWKWVAEATSIKD